MGARAGGLTTRPPRGGPPKDLDADQIVVAAIALLDDEGLAGFSMRRLADRLGVTAPTIYWHHHSRSGLLGAVAEHLLGDVAAAGSLAVAGPVAAAGSLAVAGPVVAVGGSTAVPWNEQLRSLISGVRRQYVAHPYVVELLRHHFPSALGQWTAAAVRILRSAGVDDATATHYARFVAWHIVELARTETSIIAESSVMEVKRLRGRVRYRVRPDALPAGLPNAWSDLGTDLDTMNELFIEGLRSKLGLA